MVIVGISIQPVDGDVDLVGAFDEIQAVYTWQGIEWSVFTGGLIVAGVTGFLGLLIASATPSGYAVMALGAGVGLLIGGWVGLANGVAELHAAIATTTARSAAA